jgi:glycosyltransferase involved in cell wall biosynthesis
MRLGFHYHIPAFLKDGRIRMSGEQGCFVDSLAEHCSEVACFLHSPRPAEGSLMDYTLRSSNVRLADIGPHASVPQRMLHARRATGPLRLQAPRLDALLLRGPSPLLPAMAAAAGHLPTVLLLVGDAEAGVDDLPQPHWRKTAIRCLWRWNRQGQNKVAQRSLTFVNSRKLYDELKGRVPHLRETRTTTLRSGDYFDREDTCQRRPYRLLYTGRMDRGKGLLEIVEALAALLSAGADLVLDLVGWPERGDPVLDELRALAESRGISQRVIYHGRKAVGPELFALYKQADLFVIASKCSEGFPRTIWEAMAHSLPVVATRVGSIPQFVDGAAELVPPNDVSSLSGAIRSLIHSPARRKELIRNGRALASKMTLEKQVMKMVAEIEQFVTEKK